MVSGSKAKKSEVSPPTWESLAKMKRARYRKKGKGYCDQQDRDDIVSNQRRARAALKILDIINGLHVADEAAHHEGRYFPSKSEVDVARRYLGRRTRL
jgi:hypothetical protein